MPLSEAVTAALDVLGQCAGDLSAVRQRLRRKELPEKVDLDESELPRPVEQARHIAARLEMRAGTLWDASGEVGDQPGLSDDQAAEKLRIGSKYEKPAAGGCRGELFSCRDWTGTR